MTQQFQNQAPSSDCDADQLQLRGIALDDLLRWAENPKRHDLQRIEDSIETHGFGDPPKFDATLGALVYGNGRIEALERMRSKGKSPPRGIRETEEDDWVVPVIFGVDAESKGQAVAFALDHNNISLLGGDLGFTDILQIWDEAGLQAVLEETPDAADLLVSLDRQDIDALLIGPDFEPVSADEQSRLDRKKHVTCPECGHDFKP